MEIFYQALALLLLVFFAGIQISAVAQVEPLPLTSFFPYIIYLNDRTRSFTINVNIENLQASQKVVGVEMRLEYNVTLVSFVGMFNGSFWKDYGEVFTIVESEMGFPIIGILLLAPYTRFPEGNGTIAALSFEVHALGDSFIRVTRLYMTTPESAPYIPEDSNFPYAYLRPTWNRADLNADGEIDVSDLSVFAKAFASRPGQYRWNTNVDIDGNQMIDIVDAAKIANDFGKHQ